MANLITLDRALQQISQAQECDYPTVNAIISGVSAYVETYCQRTFAQGTYDELHSFQYPTPYLFVGNPPISDVNWVRSCPQPACYVQYADANNNTQQATVHVTSTAVVLKRIYNGTTTTNSFTFAAYPTFTDLATAINNVSGWTCTTNSQFALWQTADMIQQGAYGARNVSCALTVYWWYLSNYWIDSELGQIYNPGSYQAGTQTYRVSYTGGYSTIPADLQQAVAELVQMVFATTKLVNPLMQSETLDKYSYSRAQADFNQLSVASKQTLQNYRIMSVSRYRA